MKTIEKCGKCFYCFNSLSTNKIEIIIIILSGIGVILTIIGLSIIPWKYTSKIMKIFQVLSLIFFFLFIFISSFFLILRKKEKINKCITICILFGLLELFLCIFAIFINLFTTIGALPDFNDYNKEEEKVDYSNLIGNSNNYEYTKSYLVSNGEYNYAIIYLIIIIFIWIILPFLCISDLIRIKLGISDSYNDYIKTQKEQETNRKSSEIFVGNNKILFPIDKNVEEISYNKPKEKEENGMVSPKKLSDKLKNQDKVQSINYNLHRMDSEKKNILRYSYKEKFAKRKKNFNSVDDVIKQKNENDKYDKTKYLEKYLEGNGANPYYSNFGNKSILNISTMNNSINPEN